MKSLEKFTHRLTRLLKRHLKKYGRSREPETLHQIRVDIKKIKAILAVMEDSIKGFQAHKYFIPFREIFRRASDIREPDVLNQLFLQYRVEGVSKDLMTDKSRALAKAFELDIPHFIKTVKSQAKKLEGISREVHRKDFRQYLRLKKEEVKEQLYPQPRMSMIHKARKSVKEVIYLSEVQGTLKKNESTFYNKLQHIIGQLHDKQVLSSLLKNKKANVSSAQLATIKSAYFSDKQEIVRLVHSYFG